MDSNEKKRIDENNFYTSGLYCNYEKQLCINGTIYNRNYPSCKMPLTISHRPVSTKSCNYTKNNDHNKKTEIDLCKFEELDYNCIFNPGKSSHKGYANNIDVDSDMKKLYNYQTRCPKYKYQPDELVENENTLKNVGENLTQILKNNTVCNQKVFEPNDLTNKIVQEQNHPVGIHNPYLNICRPKKYGIDTCLPGNSDKVINISSCNRNVCTNPKNLPLCNKEKKIEKDINWKNYSHINCIKDKEMRNIRNYESWDSNPYILETVSVNNREKKDNTCNSLFNNSTKKKIITPMNFNYPEILSNTQDYGDNLLD
tara:strand:- start:389 stop:1327 length:939 start_codon:yes stop_codon:yes gene_type:complete